MPIKFDESIPQSNISVLDLFCGCGGLSLGFAKAGYSVVMGVDFWKDALVTYEYNHPNSKSLCADLSTLKPRELEKRIGKNIDVIIGGPPCQGFSIAGKRILEDKRNELYKSFVAMVEYFKPKAFVMENVPNILSIGNGMVKDSILKDFETIGYSVKYKVLLASNYGVPQNRKRAVFVGMLGNTNNFDFPAPTTPVPVTSYDAISDLPEETLSDGSSYLSEPKSDYQRLMRKNCSHVFNHEVTVHDAKTVKIISMVPNGGNYKDLPIELQSTRKVHIAWTRLDSNKPSFTIDTGHRHHFHYEYNRIPTARESARIQSFPDDFVFKCSKTSQLKQIGNAVPPLMAEEIAKQLKRYL